MKKYAYLILVALTGVFFLLIVMFSKKPEVIPGFKERQGSVALTGEWLNAKQAIEGLLARIKQDPDDVKSMLALAQAYVQEARVTGDHAYYDKASLEILEEALKRQPENFEALSLKALVLLSQHHFTEGKEIAKKAVLLNPNNSFIYGILCDANVELGNYEEAVKMADKMVEIRPDSRSYSRISYLREIYGDIPGAIQAMTLSVEAGYPGLEQTEWTRMILAHLYESTGKLDSAEMQYGIALHERPDYPFAIAGFGRIDKAKKNYAAAIKQYEKAKSMIVECSFADELTDLYKLAGETEKAKASADEVVEQLGANAGDESESTHGHYADKELAYAYLKIPDTEKALKHAMIEYERRPENIDVCEAVGWVHYKRNEFAAANKFIAKALRTGSRNPVLMCRAGLVKVKAGELLKGKELIKNALEQNPFLDPELVAEAAPYLK